MKQISKNIFADTQQPGCNPGYLVTGEGIVLIDSPQQPSYAMRLNEELGRQAKILYLINTEHHIDHIMGNYFFSVPIISHEKTRDAISAISNLPMDSKIVEKIKRLDPDFLPQMDKYFVKIPTITFSDNLTLYLGKHTLELIHFPGHTAGQTGIYIPEERVIFTGDNIFYKVQTFIHQGYPEQWIDSLKKIESMDVDFIIPGHGDICDKSYIPEQISFIEEWVEAIKEAIQEGLSKEEAQEKISFLDRYPMDIGHPLERGFELQRINVARLYDIYK